MTLPKKRSQPPPKKPPASSTSFASSSTSATPTPQLNSRGARSTNEKARKLKKSGDDANDGDSDGGSDNEYVGERRNSNSDSTKAVSNIQLHNLKQKDLSHSHTSSSSRSSPMNGYENGNGNGNDEEQEHDIEIDAIQSKTALQQQHLNKTRTDSPSISPNPNNNQTTKSNHSRKDIDEHPYAKGAIIEVLYTFDGTNRLCDIIERAPVLNAIGDHGDGNNGVNMWKYYIHFHDENRRMDEWVLPNRITSVPSMGLAKSKVVEKERKKNAERKVDVEHDDKARGVKEDEKGGDGGDDGGGRLSRRKKRESDDVQMVGNETASQHATLTRHSSSSSASASASSSSNHVVHSFNEPQGTSNTNASSVSTMESTELDEHEGLDEASLREHEEVTKVKNVSRIQLGANIMDTWYFSPLPKEVLNAGTGLGDVKSIGTTNSNVHDKSKEKETTFLHIDTMYIDESTLNFFTSPSELTRFQRKLGQNRHPPGNEIYRDPKSKISMFEVDGSEQRMYCQNLCYIAKLFLDHKTLYFDVDPFLFYVLCEVDNRGYHPVGYYSKEKYSDVGYNLACILTLPCHQRKGYGRFLISFSYELSKLEEKVGSPEKPMSDLGQQAYKPYWISVIIDYLLNQACGQRSISIMDIAKNTSIMTEDIIYSLNQVSLLKVSNGVYFISSEIDNLNALQKKYPIKAPIVEKGCLHWTPYLTDVKRDKFCILSKRETYAGEKEDGGG